jgi:hypothetical protein
VAVPLRNARKKRATKSDVLSAQRLAAESAIDKIGLAAQDALVAVATTVGPAIDEAKERITPVLSDAKDRIGPALGDAKDRIGPALGDAKDRIGPALGDARDRMAPVVDTARDRLAPAAGVAVAAGKRGGMRAAVKLGLAEEPAPPKSHKLRNLLIVLGLGALAALVYTKLSGKDADPAWTAGRDSAAAAPDQPAPAQPVAGVPATSDQNGTPGGTTDHSDTAPTAPLASQETVESPVPTTPDQPLESKDL